MLAGASALDNSHVISHHGRGASQFGQPPKVRFTKAVCFQCASRILPNPHHELKHMVGWPQASPLSDESFSSDTSSRIKAVHPAMPTLSGLRKSLQAGFS